MTMGRRENGLVTLTPVTSQWGSSTTDMWGRKQLGDSQDLGKGPSHLQGADTSLSRLSAGACGGCAPRANLAVTAARGRAEVLYRRHQEKHDGGRRTQKRGSPDIKFLLGPLPCGGACRVSGYSAIRHPPRRGVSGVAIGDGGSFGETLSGRHASSPGKCKCTSARRCCRWLKRVQSGDAAHPASHPTELSR